MRPLTQLAAEARSLGREKFLARYAHPFLVLSTPTPDETPTFTPTTPAPIAIPPMAMLETTDGEEIPAIPAPTLPGVPSPVDPGALAFPVTKSDRNPFAHMITIGRARNNDIIIEAQFVSKVHAVIETAAAGYTLRDHASKNGTLLDGRRLVGEERAPLANGARIQLAPGISLGFWTPQELFEILGKRA
jgi:hypothetical protein